MSGSSRLSGKTFVALMIRKPVFGWSCRPRAARMTVVARAATMVSANQCIRPW
jgi:hypothetical protein